MTEDDVRRVAAIVRNSDRSGWTIDKRIPIPAIVVMVMTVGGWILMLGSAWTTMQSVQRVTDSHTTQIALLQGAVDRLATQMEDLLNGLGVPRKASPGR